MTEQETRKSLGDITVEVDGDWEPGDIPGRIVFLPYGSFLEVSYTIIPDTDNTTSLAVVDSMINEEGMDFLGKGSNE